MDGINVKSAAVTNGVVQIVAGAVFVIFTIAGFFFFLTVNNFVGAGIWTGLLSVAGGIVTIVAGVERSSRCVLASLTLAIVGIFVGLINFWIHVRTIAFPADFYRFYRFFHRCWSSRRGNTSCSDWKYHVTVCLSVILTITAFKQLVAAVWVVVSTSRAIRDGNANVVDATTSDFVNRHAKSSSIVANSIAQAATTVVSMVTGGVILFVVAYGVQSGKNDQRGLREQTLSPWVGPIFLLAAFLGFRAARKGENSSLIAFLCLNVLGVSLAPLCEFVGSASALADRWLGMQKCDFYGWSQLRRNCSYEFFTPLVVLNSIIILAAVAHWAFSIWGTVAAAIALHRDKTGLHRCGCGCRLPRLDEATTQNRYVVACPQSMQSIVSTTAALGNIVPIADTRRTDHTSDPPEYEAVMMSTTAALGNIVTILDTRRTDRTSDSLEYEAVMMSTTAASGNIVTIPDTRRTDRTCDPPEYEAAMMSTTAASGNIVPILDTRHTNRTSDPPEYEAATMNGSHVAINGLESEKI